MYKNKRKLHATQSFIFKNEKDSYWYRERHHPLGVVKIGHGNPLGNPCRLGTLLSPAVTINLSFHRGRSHFLMSLHQVLFCMKFHHWKSSEQSTMQELACFSKSLNYKGRKKKKPTTSFYKWGNQRQQVSYFMPMEVSWFDSDFVTLCCPMERHRSLQKWTHLIYLGPGFRIGLSLKGTSEVLARLIRFNRVSGKKAYSLWEKKRNNSW